jgi:hypothetical protein
MEYIGDMILQNVPKVRLHVTKAKHIGVCFGFIGMGNLLFIRTELLKENSVPWK